MGDSVKTIADIAKIAGVSKSTVSRALNDSPLLNPETKTRIREIAREHQFAVHQGARCLSLSRTETIAMIIPVVSQYVGHFITDPFFVELLRGVMVATAEYGYDLLIGQPPKHDVCDIQRYIDSKRADGMIVIGCQGYIDAVSHFVGRQAPIIFWGATENSQFCMVNSDNVKGGRLAVQHLLVCGRRRIAFVGGFSGEPEVKFRYRGYCEILEETGPGVNPEFVVYGDYTSRAGYELMQDLLRKDPAIDGVFACSDLMALGVMEALRENGRRVPEDVSVVGFDDVPLAEYCSPPLTTIRQPIAKAGEVMVNNLMDYLNDKIITRTILPVELIVRKSSLPA